MKALVKDIGEFCLQPLPEDGHQGDSCCFLPSVLGQSTQSLRPPSHPPESNPAGSRVPDEGYITVWGIEEFICNSTFVVALAVLFMPQWRYALFFHSFPSRGGGG